MSPRRSRAPIPPPPPLADRVKPGLVDTLEGLEDPRFCRSCGAQHAKGNPLRRFIECDAFDRVPPVREARVIVLCAQCWDRIGEPHPRAYHELPAGASWPGCMGVCVACTWRAGVRCTNPDATTNGGAGLGIAWDKPPAQAIVCGGPAAGVHVFHEGPVRTCRGRRLANTHNTQDEEQRTDGDKRGRGVLPGMPDTPADA